MTYHTDLLHDLHNHQQRWRWHRYLRARLLPKQSVEVHAVGLDMTTLDSILEKVESPIMVLKLDVEGHESLVLKGGELSVFKAEVPYMMFEFVPSWLKKQGRGS